MTDERRGMTDQQRAQWTTIRTGGALRFILGRGILPMTLTGVVCIVLFWVATPSARAESMLDLWYLAPWFAALGLLISSIGWLANERMYQRSYSGRFSEGGSSAGRV